MHVPHCVRPSTRDRAQCFLRCNLVPQKGHGREGRHPGPIPNMTTTSSGDRQSRSSPEPHSAVGTHHLPLYFCASNSELTLLRAVCSQNIPYSSISLCLCPYLRAGDQHSAFMQNRKRYLFLPAECRLDFTPHTSLGPVPYWID